MEKLGSSTVRQRGTESGGKAKVRSRAEDRNQYQESNQSQCSRHSAICSRQLVK
ncbi:unnamed protein product [Staurois parvus]|uniref:Uncharacterized protein n=1 Tax=Staurois parvus TaxID=386267 RepID=A0ABN9ELE3_9NEOB|nr:unnamed protein product [Staurois parvus]